MSLIRLSSNQYIQQQSQILNKKLIQLIRSRQQISQNQKQIFTPQQILNIQKRFQQLCSSSQMDYNQFRKGLGLLGREQSFLSRIFYLLDQDQDGYLTFQDFLKYLDIMLKGSDLQKTRFSWLLLTQGKGQIQLHDLANIFQEISVVWNALTGQIITPKKKYIQQLFNIFDIDQDQLITFQDFQVYFEQHPNLFGWFQYLNNVQIDDQKVKQQLSDIRKKLREKLNIQTHLFDQLTYEEIGHRIKDSQNVIQKKFNHLTQKLKITAQQHLQKHQFLVNYSKKNTFQHDQSLSIIHTTPLIQTQVSTIKSNITKTSNNGQSVSLKSLFKYNHQMNLPSMSLIKTRRQRQQKEQKINSSIQLIKQLQSHLNQVYKLMEHTQDYRQLKGKEKKYSPTKLKQLEVKFNIVDKEMNNQRKEKQNKLKHKQTKLKHKQNQLKHKQDQLKNQLNHNQTKSNHNQNKINHNNQNKINQNQNNDNQKSQKDKQTKQKSKMTVYFGHQNWNVVLNIMVGLRKSVKSLYQLSKHFKIKEQNFSQEHQFVLGNKTTFGKDSQVYKFVEKAPLIFQRLRQICGLSNEQYQRSVGPQSLLNQLFFGNLQALNQKCSTGKSGAFFYLTLDNKIFLKTITKSQFVFFQKLLKPYYQHMRTYTNSLIVRIYGLYKLKVFINKQKQKTIYFISMENIFTNISKDNQLECQEVYDLKGSLYNRTGERGSELKDNDWINNNKSIKLDIKPRQIFIDQVIIDSKFFKKNNINDYSMMIAIIPLHQQSKLIQKQTQNVFKRFSGGIKSSQPNLLYVISIIDFLTSFQTFKNMEYLLKSTFLSKDVSCVPPAEYSKRFRDFILNSVATVNQ